MVGFYFKEFCVIIWAVLIHFYPHSLAGSTPTIKGGTAVKKTLHLLWFLWWSAKWYYTTSIPIPRTVTQRELARPIAKKLLLKYARIVWRMRKLQKLSWSVLDYASKLPSSECAEQWPPERLSRFERGHKRYERKTERARRKHASFRKFLEELFLLDPEWDADPERFLKSIEKSRQRTEHTHAHTHAHHTHHHPPPALRT
jgi:hypothetical protein